MVDGIHLFEGEVEISEIVRQTRTAYAAVLVLLDFPGRSDVVMCGTQTTL